MVETAYKLNQGNEKLVEKLIVHEKIQYTHMVFPGGEGLPEHRANAELYFTVLRGILSLRLENQENHKYPVGSVVNVPYNTLMNVRNLDKEVLELVLIKSMPTK
ncbi:cupin domain-containing protein [Mycoplasmatota bacterium WC30]